MIRIAGVFAHNLVHNANGLEHILLWNRILTKLGRRGIEAIGRTRDRNDAERLAKPVKVSLLLNAELLARLAAARLEILVHARVPHGIGHQMRPNAQRQIEQRLRHVIGRERKLGGAGAVNRLGVFVALRIVHPIEPFTLFDNRGRCSRRTRRRTFKQRRHIGVPKLMLAWLRNGLGLGKVRDAIRDGVGNTGNHVPHKNVRNHAAKQKGIAVAHVIGKRAGTRQKSFRLSDMNIPTWHSHPRKNPDNYTIRSKSRARPQPHYAATILLHRFRFHMTAREPRPRGDIDRYKSHGPQDVVLNPDDACSSRPSYRQQHKPVES